MFFLASDNFTSNAFKFRNKVNLNHISAQQWSNWKELVYAAPWWLTDVLCVPMIAVIL